MKISFRKLKEEWEYIYEERLGIMTEGDEPSDRQREIARDEADAHVEKCKQYLEKTQNP